MYTCVAVVAARSGVGVRESLGDWVTVTRNNSPEEHEISFLVAAHKVK